MFNLVKGFGLAVALLVPLHLLDRCSLERDINARWVAKIRESSGRVTSVIAAGDIELEAEDKLALERLDAEQASRDRELEELRSRRDTIPVSDACNQCRIPAGRLLID